MATISGGLQNFSEQILKYFLDFIETDFKRQQAPRRKIALRNDAGFRTGLPEKVSNFIYSYLGVLRKTRCWRYTIQDSSK